MGYGYGYGYGYGSGSGCCIPSDRPSTIELRLRLHASASAYLTFDLLYVRTPTVGSVQSQNAISAFESSRLAVCGRSKRERAVVAGHLPRIKPGSRRCAE